MRRTLLLVLLLAFSAALAQGTIGLSLSTLNNPFFVTLRDGAQAAADEAGANLIVTDAQDSVSTQISDIEDLITRGVDVLIVNATDSAAVVPAVTQANAAGIPVIAVDRGVDGGDLAYYVASDNEAGGAAAAEYVCDALDGEGNVVELEGIPGTTAARARGAGFNEYLSSSCQGLDVVARQTANFDRGEGLSVMENILVAQPEIDAVFAHNDEMALGALQAIQASGREMVLVGFDATDDARAAVDRCEMHATVAQLPADLGATSVELAAELAAGAEVPEETENVAVPLELVTNPDCE